MQKTGKTSGMQKVEELEERSLSERRESAGSIFAVHNSTLLDTLKYFAFLLLGLCSDN